MRRQRQQVLVEMFLQKTAAKPQRRILKGNQAHYVILVVSVVPVTRGKLIEKETADKFPRVRHLNVDEPAHKRRQTVFGLQINVFSTIATSSINEERPYRWVTSELEVGEIWSNKVPDSCEHNFVRKAESAVKQKSKPGTHQHDYTKKKGLKPI